MRVKLGSVAFLGSAVTMMGCSVNDMLREFESKSEFLAEQYFEAMPQEHPVAVMLRGRFGGNKRDWALEINRLMTNLVKRPEESTPRQWQASLEKELGWSHAELRKLVPVVERLTDVRRGIYSNLARQMTRSIGAHGGDPRETHGTSPSISLHGSGDPDA